MINPIHTVKADQAYHNSGNKTIQRVFGTKRVIMLVAAGMITIYYPVAIIVQLVTGVN
ncbi:hypothetical protein [Saccharibacillus brassicae]|uniref:hypothetical protein n=1 Tax=Saccharibacillus brassicae TaxID=2583377 RepID=UPI0014780A2D|nr:hypothetical protein [Saccharibacillus brassicae]